MRPLGDRIVLKTVKADEQTKGGIYIPENAKEKPVRATVVAVGPGRVLEGGRRLEPCVKVGDEVLFSKYAGTEIKLDGDDHLVVREDDILGIIGE